MSESKSHRGTMAFGLDYGTKPRTTMLNCEKLMVNLVHYRKEVKSGTISEVGLRLPSKRTKLATKPPSP
jgi:hypothetical protein